MTTTTPESVSRLADLEIPDLALRARGGSLPAMNELVVRFETRLFNFLLRRIGSRDDAEDLTQDAFIRAWERIDRYDPRWQFSTWLYTIAGRLAITHHQRSRRHASVDVTGHAEASPEDDPTRRVATREECDHVWRLADRVLTDTQHTALWLRYAEDLSPREIARILGKTAISVRVMMLRARRVLAEHLVAEEADEPGREPAVRRLHLAANVPQPLRGEL